MQLMVVLFVFKQFYILFSDHHFAAAAEIFMGKINKTMQQKYTDSQLLSMSIQSKQNAAELCQASLKVELTKVNMLVTQSILLNAKSKLLGAKPNFIYRTLH